MIKPSIFILYFFISLSTLEGFVVINLSSKEKVLSVQEVYDPEGRDDEEKYLRLTPLNEVPKKLTLAPKSWKEVKIESCQFLQITIEEEELKYNEHGNITGGTITKEIYPVEVTKPGHDLRNYAVVFRDEDPNSPLYIANKGRDFRFITWPPQLVEFFLQDPENFLENMEP